MTTRMKILGGLGILVIAAGAAGWYVFLRDNAPEKVSLASALNSIAQSTSVASTGTTSSASASAAVAQPATAATTAALAARTVITAALPGIDGTWNVDNTVDSFVGYRVKEELARIGAATAVGRTPVVSGTAVIAGGQLMSVTVTADLTRLKSDAPQRDNQLRTQAIETNTFPTATFTLTSAMAVPAGLAGGQQISTTISGTLELHGVTNTVQVPVQATIANGFLGIVGSLEIVFADYSVKTPSSAAVLTVEDHGIMELQLFLKKS